MMIVFLLALVVLGTSLGDVFMTVGMKQHEIIDDFRPGPLGRSLAVIIRNRWIILSIAAFAVSFFGFMGLVSVADLSFAVPATASAYVIETVLAVWILKETVSRQRWLGAILVAIGVVLISL
ncbi:MAG TPA: EamA family transporter [Bryobacterales bacterium]|jgi:drug/metabolite transporter (DMT)-like permease|nr:EamA family transporter [Bryobacterales bacterium]